MSFKIILYALLAAFILYRLWLVLGRRIGHEDTPPVRDPFKNNVVSLKSLQQSKPSHDDEEEQKHWYDLGLSEKVCDRLSDIRKVDTQFSVIPFISGAKVAFEMIINSFVANNKETLRPLLNDAVYQDYSKAIDARYATGETLDITIQTIQNVEILDAILEKKTALITVRFTSQQLIKACDRDSQILSISPEGGEQVVDVWMFARTVTSRDPNWVVISTLEEDDISS